MKVVRFLKQHCNAVAKLDTSLDAAALLENKPKGLLVFEDKKLVGFIFYESIDGITSINNIVVDESCRRRGFGSILVEALIRESVTIDTFVDERNLGAQLFLKACGFVVEATTNPRTNRAVPRKRTTDGVDYYYMYRDGGKTL